MPSVREVGSPADASAPDRTHLPHVPAPEHERRPRRVAPSRLRGVRPTPRQSAVGHWQRSEAERSRHRRRRSRSTARRGRRGGGGRGRHRRRPGGGFEGPAFGGPRDGAEERVGVRARHPPDPAPPLAGISGSVGGRTAEGCCWRAARWRRYARQPAPSGAPGAAPGPRTRASTHARNCRFSSATSAAPPAPGRPSPPGPGPGVRPRPPPPPPSSGLPRFPSAGGMAAVFSNFCE